MTIASYLISIAGISIVTVMIEAVLPEGNMAAFVRRIAALIVIFVIIAPIPSLIKNQSFDFGFETSSESKTINNDLLTIIYRQKAKELSNVLTEALLSEGIECEISASPELTQTEYKISYISIKILKGEKDYESIKKTVKKYVSIEDSRIFIT